MPHYSNLLLSSWTPQFLSPTTSAYPPPAKIPPQVLSTMKINDNVAYAALPKELRGRRNRAVVSSMKDQGRFRSGKGRRDDDVSCFCVACFFFGSRANAWCRSTLNISRFMILSTRSLEYIERSRSNIQNSGSRTLISGKGSSFETSLSQNDACPIGFITKQHTAVSKRTFSTRIQIPSYK
jgi:hypothetical protein